MPLCPVGAFRALGKEGQSPLCEAQDQGRKKKPLHGTPKGYNYALCACTLVLFFLSTRSRAKKKALAWDPEGVQSFLCLKKKAQEKNNTFQVTKKRRTPWSCVKRMHDCPPSGDHDCTPKGYNHPCAKAKQEWVGLCAFKRRIPLTPSSCMRLLA